MHTGQTNFVWRISLNSPNSLNSSNGDLGPDDQTKELAIKTEGLTAVVISADQALHSLPRLDSNQQPSD